MRDAVIVSTARTPIGKAYRGAFNDTQAQTLGGHAIAHAVDRAGIDPAEVEDVVMGAALQQGSTHMNVARQALIRAGLPNPLTACCGSSTPKLTSSATAKRPVSSGANQPLMNSTSETANTSRVINPCGVLAAARKPADSGTAYGRRAAVNIFEAHDVVFSQVGAALNFDHFNRDLAGIAEAMLRS